ncbi:MAG: DUF3810 domain-containing protein [Niameybacter sp.]|uniref:DUF3810 domain-containing protein n=1 Tax=Niameybacter sp. TaxID=2033640 RepID=UPI002FCB0565
MQLRLKLLSLLLIPFSLLLSYLYTLAPEKWEQYYSLGINKCTIQILSTITGIFPFSLFEWGIYLGLGSLILYTLYTLFKCITQFQDFFRLIGTYVLNIGCIGSILFFIFIAFWGVNYKRPHFSEHYGIEIGEYSTEELGEVYAFLLSEGSKARSKLPTDENGVALPLGDYRDIFKRAQLGYDVAGEKFTVLNGNYGKAKPVLASPLMNYTGITGIYSPFTAEPNVNISVPSITIPATTCHEMAHQRGYGFENECNFIAYITALSHPDPDFQYSAYIMAIAYTSNALATADRDLLLSINANMPEGIYTDLVAINTFWDGYKGEVQEATEQANNAYLQSNGVAAGTASYGEMVNLILAFYDKYY